MSTNRADNVKTIEALYGFSAEYVMDIVEKLGPEALSDIAIHHIAAKQIEAEERRGARLQRIADYQREHPAIGWETAERALYGGLF